MFLTIVSGVIHVFTSVLFLIVLISFMLPPTPAEKLTLRLLEVQNLRKVYRIELLDLKKIGIIFFFWLLSGIYLWG